MIHLYLDQDGSCHVYRNLFLITKLVPPQKTYNLAYMSTFWVRDELFTWIRTAASRIQQLPGVKKFIFDDKIGFPIAKNT